MKKQRLACGLARSSQLWQVRPRNSKLLFRHAEAPLSVGVAYHGNMADKTAEPRVKSDDRLSIAPRNVKR